jgi:hypothetical protein
VTAAFNILCQVLKECDDVFINKSTVQMNHIQPTVFDDTKASTTLQHHSSDPYGGYSRV